MLTQKEQDRAIRNGLILSAYQGGIDTDTLARIFKVSLRTIQAVIHDSVATA